MKPINHCHRRVFGNPALPIQGSVKKHIERIARLNEEVKPVIDKMTSKAEVLKQDVVELVRVENTPITKGKPGDNPFAPKGDMVRENILGIGKILSHSK